MSASGYTIYDISDPSTEITTIEKEWRILKKNISLSNTSAKTYTYDGTTRCLSYSIPSKYQNMFTTSEPVYATDAGTYYYYINWDDTTNFTVNSNSTGQIALKMTIKPATITLPSVTTLQYTGGSQKLMDFSLDYSIEQVDDEIVVRNTSTTAAVLKYSGTLEGTEIGNYSATLTLLDTYNYKFSPSGDVQTINWEISKYVIELPTQTLFNYNGSTKTLMDLSGVVPNSITTTGDVSAHAMGDYTFTITIDDTDHYILSDNSTYASINWYIKTIIDLPFGSVFNYDGKAHSIMDISELTGHITTSGTVSATEIGDYTFTITVTDNNYMLSDGTMSATINWSIESGYRLKLVTINSQQAYNMSTGEYVSFNGIVSYVDNGTTTQVWYEETNYYELTVQKLNASTGEWEDTDIQVQVVGGNCNDATINNNILREWGSNAGSKKFTAKMFATYEKEDHTTRTLTFDYTIKQTWAGPF